MGLFSKKIVVFLTQNGLVFYKTKRKEFLKLTFPSEISSYQEILNEKKFESLIAGFLAQFTEKEKKDVIMILSSNLVYSKVISKIKTREKEKSEEEFIKSLPLAKFRVVIKTIPMGKDEIIFATNRSFYESVVGIFSQNGFGVPIVASVTLFTNSSVNNELSQALLNEIRKESKALEVGNFLSLENEMEAVEDAPDEDEEDEELKPHQSIKQYLMLIISVAILIGALSYTLISLGIINNPFGGGKNTSATDSASLTAMPTATPTLSPDIENALNSASSSVSLTRETVKIQILNGSGIEGQAGTIESVLADLGYLEIETGNTDAIKEITVIQYKNGVSDEMQSEINGAVNEISSKPDVLKNQTIENFDIIITTGRE
ncbi:MAG: LytR C-terminal domain-containing protein [Candidatus Levybacteria bacterium]|nr:LytR C-terminal domain-containing protein [Candidatus Levybacteria bacterium]